MDRVGNHGLCCVAIDAHFGLLDGLLVLVDTLSFGWSQIVMRVRYVTRLERAVDPLCGAEIGEDVSVL